MSTTKEIKLPGLGLPYDHYAKLSADDSHRCDPKDPMFPFAVDESWKASTITTRERAMLAFMDLITDKPDWERKVFDDKIVEKWGNELDDYRRELGVVAKQEKERREAEAQALEAAAEAAMQDIAASENTENTGGNEEESQEIEMSDDDDDESGSDGDILDAIETLSNDDEDEDMSESSDSSSGSGTESDEANGESPDDKISRQAAVDAAYARLPKGLQAYFDNLRAGVQESAAVTIRVEADAPGEDASEGDAKSTTSVAGEVYVDWSGDDDSGDTLDAPFPYNRGFTDKMYGFCISELRDKAKIAKESGITSVLESSACVLKSDSVVSEELRLALRDLAYSELENLPEDQKDWHPGSDETVLDLVHPSLFPLVYGRTRALTDRVIASPEAALEQTGAGEVVSVDEAPITREAVEAYVEREHYYFGSDEEVEQKREADIQRYLSGEREMKLNWKGVISKRFQWLPAEVSLGPDGPKFESYINNLHPIKHKALYPVLADVLGKTLPMLDAAVERCMTFDVGVDPRKRINAMRTVRKCETPEICKKEGYCNADNRPRNVEMDDDNEDDEWELNEKWYEQTHPVKQPNPKEYLYVGVPSYKTSGFFNNTDRIQVIVKLANIHLTPEKPAYKGGSWHLEGQLNERIAATALYYYDCDNISESRLSFRTPADAEEMSCEFGYEQSDFSGPEALFDISTDWDEGVTLMDHGSVLTRQGRALVFPNVYQHHVEPFELADKTKPGHRKILAFFLVDPKTRVISTENVPPQQTSWGGLGQRLVESRLPVELAQQVMKDVECPYDLEVAKEIRLELMKERSALESKVDEELKSRTWNFCEH